MFFRFENMASSSVSQDDIDNDFEKNNRRSRIRTARARQINPSSGCRMESSNIDNQGDLADHTEEHVSGTMANNSCQVTHPGGGPGGAGPSGSTNINKYDKLVAAADENAEHETSPKPIIRSTKEKRPNKMHHANKGKQQRDRRKLREKRRSTGKFLSCFF